MKGTWKNIFRGFLSHIRHVNIVNEDEDGLYHLVNDEKAVNSFLKELEDIIRTNKRPNKDKEPKEKKSSSRKTPAV